MKVTLKWISPLNSHFIGNTLRSKTTEVTTKRQPKSQLGIKDTQVVFSYSLVAVVAYLTNPRARTDLPHKAGLLWHCRQSQAKPLSITSHLVPSPLALTFPPVSRGQTSVSQRNMCSPAVVRRAVPDVRGCCRTGSPGFTWRWRWRERPLGLFCTALHQGHSSG